MSKTFLTVALVLSASVLLVINGIHTSPISGEWLVSPSDDVSYVIDDSTWDVHLDGVDATGTGGYFEGITVNKGTTFDVEVLSIDELFGVDYRFDNSTNTVTSTINNDNFLLEFINFIYYPYHECDRLTHFELDLDQVVYGPKILGWFFLEINTELWDFLTELTTNAYHEALPFYDQFDALLQAEFEFQGNLAIFDIYMNGNFENATEGTNVEFGHAIKFVWDNTTGILQGYRVSSITTGTYQNHQVEISVDVVIREVNYDLPDFKFYPGLFPGFDYLTVIVVLSTMFLSRFVYKKVKQKKSGSN
ncbi:MAG: choice-of-anchor S family protein [Candidatus Heimdallarchaeota archaeon]